MSSLSGTLFFWKHTDSHRDGKRTSGKTEMRQCLTAEFMAEANKTKGKSNKSVKSKNRSFNSPNTLLSFLAHEHAYFIRYQT